MLSASATAAQSSLFAAGLVVGGRYRLKAHIGMGAMGEVWLADHLTLGTTVAVKLVDVARHKDAPLRLARFQREARSAAQLKSPHVVQILDYGVDGPVAFITMELLVGESLEQRLARRGRLSPAEVAHVVNEMSLGVERAHAAGIVHRDIKPSNVFIAKVHDREIVKVLDFGIAKAIHANEPGQLETQDGVVLGTPAYMSPEQVLGSAVDTRSDLWQIAVVAFECLTGKRPFHGASLGQLFKGICADPIPMPSSIGNVPPGFDGWFARAAEREPARRYASAAEMSEALSSVLVGTGAPFLAALAAEAEMLRTGPNTWSTAEHQMLKRPKRNTAMIFVVGMLLPVVVLAALYALKDEPTASPAATGDARPVPTASFSAAVTTTAATTEPATSKSITDAPAPAPAPSIKPSSPSRAAPLPRATRPRSPTPQPAADPIGL